MAIGSLELGGVFGGLTQLMSIFAMVITFIVVLAVVFALVWLLKEKVFSYNIPVILKCEVGDSVIRKRDVIRINRKTGKYETNFRKNNKILADVPSDDYAHFEVGKFGKVRRCFEAFVKDDQATWVPPHPRTYEEREVTITNPVTKETETKTIKEATFVTMPSNLARFYMDRTRKNIELTHEPKWWANPVLLTGLVMGTFIIGVIFLFIMNKNTAEIALEAVRMGGRIMETAAGQVVK